MSCELLPQITTCSIKYGIITFTSLLALKFFDYDLSTTMFKVLIFLMKWVFFFPGFLDGVEAGGEREYVKKGVKTEKGHGWRSMI